MSRPTGRLIRILVKPIIERFPTLRYFRQAGFAMRPQPSRSGRAAPELGG